MAKKFYTVLLVPDASSQIRTFHIAKPLLAALAASAALVCVAFLFFIYQAVSLNGHMLELRRLRVAASQQGHLLGKVDRLGAELAGLREFDARLRTAAGLEAKEREGSFVGTGGADTPSSGTLMAAAVAHQTPSADTLTRELDRLSHEMIDRSKSFQELIDQLEAKRGILAATPTIWPVKGWLTAGFGHRRSPFTGQRQMHEGVDISNSVGTSIVAPAEGIVSYAGPLGGFGNVVSIDHGHKISTFYAHLQRHKVSRGQRVKRGDVIASLGTTGRVTGPHLHYEIQVGGAAVDPSKYVIDTATVKFLGDGESAE
ncbi:MAG: M23 family metallopeptidase [candidate division NC10 bacterium]|nr:M23 family metallopeptidase [candidate division NC10 bacterium]